VEDHVARMVSRRDGSRRGKWRRGPRSARGGIGRARRPSTGVRRDDPSARHPGRAAWRRSR
jgi:hypothetical protein